MLEIEIFKLWGSIFIDNKEANDSITKTETHFEKLSKKLGDIGESVTKTGKSLSLRLTTPLVAMGTGAIKVGMDFEQAMSKVQAMSGASAEEMVTLEKAARDAGASTSKSAKDAADALTYMALAGWDTQTSMEGLMPVLRLSEAGQIDLARASSLVTDSMSAMGIEVKDLPKYLDTVAQTARSSNTDIDQMAEAYIRVGGTLRGLNVPLEESALALGFLANAGIKGSEAGTGLNAVLLNLTAPTGRAKQALDQLSLSAFDSQGNFKGLEAVLFELRDKTKDLDAEQRNMILSMVGGKEHVKTLNALMNGLEDSYDGLKANIQDADGALLEVAETMQENNKGSITELMSAIEELALKLYDILAPTLSMVIGYIQQFVDWLNNLSPEMQQTVVLVGALAAALGPLLIVVGKVMTGISALIPVLGALASPIGLVTMAVAGLVAGLLYLYNTNETIREALHVAWEWIKELAFEVFGAIEAFWEEWGETITGIFKDLWEIVSAVFKSTLDLIFALVIQTFKELQVFWNTWGNGIKTFFQGLWNNIKIIVEIAINLISNTIKLTLNIIKGDWSGAWENIKNIVSTVLNGIINILSNSVGTMINLGKGMLQGVWDGMKGVWSSISSWVSDKVSWLADKLAFWRRSNQEMDNGTVSRRIDGSHRSGLSYVPYDGYIAELHKGERVLTASENRSLGSGGSYTSSPAQTQKVVIEVPVILDGREVARVTAPYSSRELLTLQQSRGRGMGDV